MTAVLDASADPGTPRRADRPALALGLLGVLGVLGVLAVPAWALVPLPALERGSLSRDGELVVDSDSIEETRLLVPPGGATAVQSVRNDGWYAVTLTASAPIDSFTEVVGFLPVQRGGTEAAGEPRPSLELGPGQEAAAVLRVTKGCAPYVAGSAGTTDHFLVRVSSLGRSEDQEVPFRLPVTVTGPHVPGPECAGR